MCFVFSFLDLTGFGVPAIPLKHYNSQATNLTKLKFFYHLKDIKNTHAMKKKIFFLQLL